jgi:hypothetical protein
MMREVMSSSTSQNSPRRILAKAVFWDKFAVLSHFVELLLSPKFRRSVDFRSNSDNCTFRINEPRVAAHFNAELLERFRPLHHRITGVRRNQVPAVNCSTTN